MAEELADQTLQAELRSIEDIVDRLGLMAVDVLVENIQKMCEIRVRSVERQNYMFRKLANQEKLVKRDDK